MMLSSEERERFAAYLEIEARDGLAMIEQMKKINVPEFMIKKMQSEAAASQIVAAKLRSISTETINGR